MGIHTIFQLQIGREDMFRVASDMVTASAISMGVCFRNLKEDSERIRFFTGAVTHTREALVAKGYNIHRFS